jgi:hypothetical protein
MWLGSLMTMYERIMSITDIKISDVLLATCVNHLPNNASWATFKNGLLAREVMTKTQFYTAVSAFQENERCRTTVTLQAQAPAATGPAAQGVAMLGTSGGGHGAAVRTEQQPTSSTCARCAGRHPTDECRRTRGYSCMKCGGEHYEICCTSAGSSDQFRQRRFAGHPRARGHHDSRMNPMHDPRVQPMQFMQHGPPMHMFAHPFPGPHGHGPPAHHGGGADEPQQQPSPQPQRPEGAGNGWGRTTF